MFAAEKLAAREELPLNKEKNEPEKRTFLEKLYEIKSNITVEPIFAGLIIASMLARLAIQNLNLDKACRVKLNFGDEICDSLILHRGNSTKYYEGEVQKVISSIDAWKSIIQTAIPTILVIFMGAWSDRTGNRKVCIMLPVVGDLLVCFSNIISTIFFYEIPVEVTMFFEAFFPAITGDWVLVYLGVFSYISDITDEKSRTFRVGIANLCLTAGIPIGTSLSGILLHLCGYYGVFLISSSIYVLALVYGYFCLSSNTKPKDDTKSQEPVTLKDIYTLIKETVAVAFKKRDGSGRAKIILTLLAVAIIYGPDHGERNIKYLFVRYRLKWDALKYSMYSTYSTILHSMGALFSISVFSKRWGFHDSLLCLISVGSNLVGCVYIAFVTTDLGMFMFPVVEILNATTFTSLRSMSSKLIGAEELGKMNSLFSLVETLAALMFDPSYAIMYAYTLPIFSGTIYIFSAFMTIPPIIILIYLFAKHRREVKDARAQALSEEAPKTDKSETEKREKTEVNNSVTKM